MTGSPSSCPRLIPLLTRPGQPYTHSVSRVLTPLASASASAPAVSTRSIVSHASRNQRRPCMRSTPPSLFSVTFPLGGSQRRGKKTKTRIKLEDLPQALVKADPLPDLEDYQGLPAYPTVILQARRNIQKFENCVLLTRVGGFYEIYFEQAEKYAPLLNIKVAQRKTNAGPVAMAGFPFFHLERYLKLLVLDFNCYVAIAEEFRNDPGDKVKSGGLMHDRRVTRVITPGTLIDEDFMDPYTNNFVLAVHIDHEAYAPSIESIHLDHLSAEDVNGNGNGDEHSDPFSTPIGLAWLDVSTGQFYTQGTTIASLSSILSRVGPREIVVDRMLQSRRDHQLFSTLAEDKYLITYAPEAEFLPISKWGSMLESEIPAQTVANLTSDETQAGSLLLQYVKTRLQGLSMKLQPPVRYENKAVLAMDKDTMRALEIKKTIRDGGFRGSLLHAIRRTVTNGGARLLNLWISAPSTNLDTIQARQDLVDFFIHDEIHREGIILFLKKSHDSQRLVQKFACGRGDANDLLSLANTIRAAQDIVNILVRAAEARKPNSTRSGELRKMSSDVDADAPTNATSCFAPLISRFSLEDPVKLADRIHKSIDEDGLVQQRQDEDNEASELLNLAGNIVEAEGTESDATLLPKGLKKRKPLSIRDYYTEDSMSFIMKPGASLALQDLHRKLSALLEAKRDLESTLREDLKASTLTLRWSTTLGHVCHVKGRDTRAKKIMEHTAVSSSRSTRTFHYPEWTELGQRIHQTRFEISTEESRIFANLRSAVVANLVKLRRNALVLAELDVATSFACLALEQGLTRPILNNSTAHTIIGGRHPTVEGGLREQGRSFTKNDCLVGLAANPATTSSTPPTDSTPEQGDDKPPAPSSEGRIWLITGPNMAGKSTYLRQNALITILAQAGCYVPASHATIGIVDAVFSRVGSADNLYRDQSTFMVEMIETAQILRHATPRSFVIMDEIGRGTTPEDGEAVAFACLHHLATINKCRALFATHFHGIANLVHQHGLHVNSNSGKDSDEGGGGGGGGPVEMYCTDVEEDGKGGFIYVHRLRKGINVHSHALKVARIAGLPDLAISVAKSVLQSSQASV